MTTHPLDRYANIPRWADPISTWFGIACRTVEDHITDVCAQHSHEHPYSCDPETDCYEDLRAWVLSKDTLQGEIRMDIYGGWYVMGITTVEFNHYRPQLDRQFYPAPGPADAAY